MSSVQVVQAGSVFIINILFAWLCGSVLTRRWLDAAEPAIAARCRRRLLRVDRVVCLLAGVAGLAAIWASFAAMAGIDLRDVGDVVADIIIDTVPGRLLALAVVALFVAAIAHAFARQATITAGFLLLFGLSRAQLSHAGGEGAPGVAMLADAVHLFAVGVWLGGVMVAAWVVMPAARETAPQAFMASLSRAATCALGIIVLTGVFGAWQRLGVPVRLIDHPYGLVLSVKLSFFALAAALGAYNRFIGFPLAKRGDGARALLVLRVESVLLMGTLGAAALLTMQHPPQ